MMSPGTGQGAGAGLGERAVVRRGHRLAVIAPSCLWSIGLCPAAPGESRLMAYAGVWDARVYWAHGLVQRKKFPNIVKLEQSLCKER